MLSSAFPSREFISSGKWTSALFTTYSLSLSFVESVVYPELRRQVRRCTILSDLRGYVDSLSEPGAPGAGREYEVVPVRLRDGKGVFHPKIARLSDGENVRATVGSGNLTLPGWGYSNAEVVDVLLPGRDSVCYEGLLEFLGSLTADNDRFDCDFPNLHEYMDQCRKASIRKGEGRSRFLHTVREPLTGQLSALAQEFGGAESIAIVSPFFGGTAGVRLLAQELECEVVSVAIVPNPPARFDFAACKAEGLDVRPVQSDAWKDERRLHAKVFDIRCRRGRLIMTGSPNSTHAALAGVNVEAAVVRMHGDADVYGWAPSGTHKGSPGGEVEPGPVSDECVVARYDSGKVTGRILGKRDVSGEWKCSVTWGASRVPAGAVTVDDTGRFSFATTEDLLSLGASTQVALEREQKEIRGWVTMPGLDAPGPQARVARAIGRVLSGSSDPSDINAILEYLLVSPEAFLGAACVRRAGKRSRGPAAPQDVTVPVSSLSPTSAFQPRSAHPAFGPHDYFERLLAALDRHWESSLGQVADEQADEENNEEPLQPESPKSDLGPRPGPESGEAVRSGRPRQGRTAAVRANLFEDAFVAVLEKTVALPADRPKGPGFQTLFDMALRIAPRCDGGEELEARLLEKWLNAARRLRDKNAGYDDLDRCVAALSARKVMEDPAKARGAHGTLERWLHGELDEAGIEELEPRVENPEVAGLRPTASQTEWTDAWRRIVETETSYSAVRRVMNDINAGKPLAIPNGVSSEAAYMLNRVAARAASPDRIAVIAKEWSGRPSCPRCWMVLAYEAANELRVHRITTCRSMGCGRVVVDTPL